MNEEEKLFLAIVIIISGIISDVIFTLNIKIVLLMLWGVVTLFFIFSGDK